MLTRKLSKFKLRIENTQIREIWRVFLLIRADVNEHVIRNLSPSQDSIPFKDSAIRIIHIHLVEVRSFEIMTFMVFIYARGSFWMIEFETNYSIKYSIPWVFSNPYQSNTSLRAYPYWITSKPAFSEKLKIRSNIKSNSATYSQLLWTGRFRPWLPAQPPTYPLLLLNEET